MVFLDRFGDFIAFELLGAPVVFVSRSHYLAELLQPSCRVVRTNFGTFKSALDKMPLRPQAVE